MTDKQQQTDPDQGVLFDPGQTKPVPPQPIDLELPPEPPADPTIPMVFDAVSGAEISEDGKYRYLLWRRILPKGPKALFIGLNPSTADHETDDPTIRAMCSFAKSWQCSMILVGNLFAYRATDPDVMAVADDPVGPKNTETLIQLRRQADLCIACWGNGGSLKRTGRHTMKLLNPLGHVMCLGINKTGHPKHPLYIRRDTQLIPFAYSAGEAL